MGEPRFTNMSPVVMSTEEIKRIRIEAGLTQVELAKALGVGARTVQGWEGGRCQVPPPAAMALRFVIRKDASLPSARKTNRTR